MQKAFAIENQRNMFETQYLKASITPTLPRQYNNYISTSTTLSQQSSSQEQLFIPLSYHFSEGDTNPFTMNYSQQPSIIIPQNTTSVEDFCNDGMACLSLSELNQNTCNTFSIYEASIHPTQGNLQLNDNQSYDMAQGFVNPYMSIESQSMHGLSTITTQQQLQLNNSCVIHDSYHNATFSSATVPPTINSLHQVMILIFFNTLTRFDILNICINHIFVENIMRLMILFSGHFKQNNCFVNNTTINTSICSTQSVSSIQYS